jgi:hypothetical protein
MLRAFVNTKQNDWCRFLALVEHAYNNSVQASTQQTPFFLNHGRHQDTPLSRAVPARAAVPAVAEFVEGIQEALKNAKACIHVAQQRQKFMQTRREGLTGSRSGTKFSCWCARTNCLLGCLLSLPRSFLDRTPSWRL